MTKTNPKCYWCFGTGWYDSNPGACGDPDCCGVSYEVECDHCWECEEYKEEDEKPNAT